MAQNDIIVPREGANNVLTEIVLADATTSARGLLSASDKTKLDGIAAGAEVNVNADWNASSGDAQILNKPTLGTAAAAATTDFAAASHTHAASAITSGVLDNARVNFAAPPAIGSTTPAAGSFTTLNANNGTLTASAPALNIEQTWNGAGVNFIAAQINAIRASGSSSSADAELLRLSENGTEVFRFRRTGQIVTSSLQLTATTGNISIGSNSFWFGGAGSAPSLTNGSSTALDLRNQANAMDFRIYGQYTTASNFERLSLKYSSTATAFQIGTEKGTSGSARPLQLQVDGTTRVDCQTAGSVVINGTTFFAAGGASGSSFNAVNRCQIGSAGVSCGSESFITFHDGTFFHASGADTRIRRVSAGLLEITNTTAGTFRDLVLRALMVGGTTASFPALRNSSTTLQVRLADDTAFAPFECAGLTLNGDLTASTRNIVTDTTTGTKIGTATDQKIGFWNATPAIQPAAVADATDAATVITQLNALLSRLRTIGIIAT